VSAGAGSADVGGTRSGAASERTIRGALTLIRIGPGIILLLLAVGFSLLAPEFLTFRNLTNISLQTAVLATLAIGMLFVILVAGIDLSVGSVLALSTVTGALVFSATPEFGGLVTIPVILLTGAAVGAINGIALVKGKMPHAFIPTLATFYAARGLALVLADGRAIPEAPDIAVTIGYGFIGPVPWAVILVAVLAVTAIIILRKLKWGRWIYAVGGDKEAARRAGIPVDKVIISVFIISGLMAGFAGLITMGRTASGYPTAGELAELQAIAAVIIGGASFFGGRGTVVGALVGALIIGVLQNGLNLFGVSTFWQLIVSGIIIAVAVELDVLRRMLEQRFRTLQAKGA